MTRFGHEENEGWQLPRIENLPGGIDHPDTEAALELVAAAGIILDPWQKHVFRHSLRRKDGKWAAFEVGLVVPRQNGKNELLAARELAGLFVLGERTLIHSAHRFDTSIEAFRRLKGIIENTPWLLREVKHLNGKPIGIRNSHGQEGIELRNGARIGFRTRVKGGGLGFTADFLGLDEAQELAEAVLAALVPTLSARPDPQMWYTGTAVDQFRHDLGFVLARVRARGATGTDPSLAYFEWSVDAETPDAVTPDMAADPSNIAQANPALGIRIDREHITKELAGAMTFREYCVDRLGVGDWPPTDEFALAVIDPRRWAEMCERLSAPADRSPVVFAFDVSPDRKKASIVVAGKRSDQKSIHVEVIAAREGTDWLPATLSQLSKEFKPAMILCDSVGPVASVVQDVERLGVKVKTLSTTEHAEACGKLFDAVEASQIRHRGDPELLEAIKGATQRPLGDRWAWSRRNSRVDITPLVAATFAHWGASQAKRYRSAGFN